jgi:hypothetical protein
MLAALFTAVTVVSVALALAQRFASASAFIEHSSSETSTPPEVLAFERMAHKVPHDALQEGSYILTMAPL